MGDFVHFYLDGVFCCLLTSVGLLLNGYAIWSLTRQRLTAIFHKLMLMLVMFDFAYVLFVLLCYSLPRLSLHYQERIIIYVMPYFVPLTQIFLSGSSFSTVALTIERFISVCAPFFKQRHNIKAWMFVLPVLIFVFVYGSPRFFEMEVEEDCQQRSNETLNNSTECVQEVYLKFKDLRLNPLYISIYANWMNLIFQLLIPVVVNITLNVYIYRAMHRFRGGRGCCCINKGSNSSPMETAVTTTTAASEGIRRVAGNEKELKKRDAKYTRASVFMVLAFIFCNAPRLIPNCMELLFNFDEFPEWAVVLVSVNQLLTVANSSFNFLIYLSFCRVKKRNDSRGRRQEITTENTPLTTAAIQREKSYRRGSSTKAAANGHRLVSTRV